MTYEPDGFCRRCQQKIWTRSDGTLMGHPCEPPYELPDFHPETGHLHTCADRATCDCAAWLYCIAQDAEMTAPQLAATDATPPVETCSQPPANGEQVAE